MKRTTGSTKLPQRSTRKRKVAERVKRVDASVIRDAHARRLDAFENDNYAAEQEAEALEGEDDYQPGMGSDEEMAGRKKASRSKKPQRTRSARSGSTGATARAKRGMERFNKPVALAVEEEDVSMRPAGMVSLEQITAQPSTKPARPFCSICGYQAAYTCTRCFVRFCSVQCGTVHDETRCLKFTL